MKNVLWRDLYRTACFGSAVDFRNIVDYCKVSNKTLGMEISLLNLKVFWNSMLFGFGQ